MRQPGRARHMSIRTIPRILGTVGFVEEIFDAFCLARLSKYLQGAPVRVTLWNDCSTTSDAPPVATVHVKDRSTLVRLLRAPSLAFGEAYAAGRLVISGDLVQLIEVVNRALAGRPYEHGNTAGSISRAASRDNVHVHYDIGNDFY